MLTMIKNERAFTLVEMLIVLLVISVLLLLTIPNITKNNAVINDKGCEAYIEVVQTQVELYKLETGNVPENIDDLIELEYITRDTCPDGSTSLEIIGGRVGIANGN